MKKIYAGSGYLYLTESVAAADTPRVFATEADAVAYYNARGNPPGIWVGSGLGGLDLMPGDKVIEEQMRFLFGEGMRPDAQRVMDDYMAANAHRIRKPGDEEKVAAEAVREARLGRAFPKYEQGTLDYTERFNRQVDKILIEQGREPTPGELREARKVAAQKSKQAVAGYDLVFAPVKSASMLWGLHDSQQVRAQVKWAHDAAVAEAVKYLEEHAAFTRVGAGGPAQVDTRGLVAVAFDHFDNRNGEPHLHTHLAVANRVQAASDGKWRTIDGRPLHFITVTAGAVYDSAFRAELTKRLGVEWRMRTDTRADKEPVWEIAGVKDEWIKSFASRRGGIVERYNELVADYRAQHERTPDKATERQLARTANLDTRNVKGTAKSLGELNGIWRGQFTDRFGADALKGFQRVVGKPRSISTPVSALDLAAIAEEVTARVSEYRAVWNRWNVEAAAHRTLAEHGVTLTDHAQRKALVEQITDTALGASISLEAPAVVPEPAALRRKDGVSVFTPHGAARYTSEQILNAEADLLRAATIPGVVDAVAPEHAAASLKNFEQQAGQSLDAGQRKLVESFATDTRQTVAGIGPAGTGKTTAMRALAHVLDADGRRLVPLASSGAAAAVLAAGLAYAVTGHRSQGRTVDTTHSLIDPELAGRESTYVPATRGKEANHLYFTVDVPDDQPLTSDQEQSEAQAAFVRVLDRDDAERSATETLRDNLARAGTIPDLAEKLAYTEELRAARSSVSDPLDESVLNVAPWITVAPVGEEPRPDSLAGYSSALAIAIGDRALNLAEQAIAERPHWMAYLGEQPTDPTARDMWEVRVAVICAATEHTGHDQNNPWDWAPKNPGERLILDIASVAAHQAHDLTTGRSIPYQLSNPEAEVHRRAQQRRDLATPTAGVEHDTLASTAQPYQSSTPSKTHHL